jgi:hypothetical protein
MVMKILTEFNWIVVKANGCCYWCGDEPSAFTEAGNSVASWVTISFSRKILRDGTGYFLPCRDAPTSGQISVPTSKHLLVTLGCSLRRSNSKHLFYVLLTVFRLIYQFFFRILSKGFRNWKYLFQGSEGSRILLWNHVNSLFVSFLLFDL